MAAPVHRLSCIRWASRIRTTRASIRARMQSGRGILSDRREIFPMRGSHASLRAASPRAASGRVTGTIAHQGARSDPCDRELMTSAGRRDDARYSVPARDSIVSVDRGVIVTRWIDGDRAAWRQHPNQVTHRDAIPRIRQQFALATGGASTSARIRSGVRAGDRRENEQGRHRSST